MTALVICIATIAGSMVTAGLTYLNEWRKNRVSLTNVEKVAEKDQYQIVTNIMNSMLEGVRGELKSTKEELSAARAQNTELQTSILELRIELAETRHDLKATQAELAHMQEGK